AGGMGVGWCSRSDSIIYSVVSKAWDKPVIRELMMTTRQEWLLMALAYRNGQPMTPAQIQKAMFLMSVEAPQLVGPRFYDFIPYNYGPFDARVYHDLDAMADNGLITSTHFPGRSWKLYVVTPTGLTEATRSKRQANMQGVNYLE